MIRLKTIYAGANGVCQPGQTITLSDAEEKSLIAGGYAEPAEPGAPKRNRNKRETAVDPGATGGEGGPETATES